MRNRPKTVRDYIDEQVDLRIKSVYDENGELKNVSRIIVESEARGLAEGIAEGKAEGKAEGIAEGEAKGKQELIITFLASRSLPLSEISRITGMPVEQLRALAKQNNIDLE
jgi:predicted transposase YdaD